MNELHAKLSPSDSKLDLYCPGNRNEQAKVPEERTEHSAKGTGAHKLGETCLTTGTNTLQYINWWVGETNGQRGFILGPEYTENSFEKGVRFFRVDAKMAADVRLYVDQVRKDVGALPGAKLGVEMRSVVNTNIWGTVDAGILQYFGALTVDDYKNGRIYVDAYENSQLMLYAIGLILEYRMLGIEFTKVIMRIIQPNAPEGGPVRTFGPLTPTELLKWLEDVYLPAAERCLDPNAPLIPGNWCKDCWCDARHECPALAGFTNQVAQGMFSPVVAERPRSLPDPISMTPEQRKIILDNKDLVADWLEKIYKHEYKMHMQGQGTWGKLVKGKNSRNWINNSTVEAKVQNMLGKDAFNPGTLKSPAQAETELKSRGFSQTQAYEKIKDMISVLPGQPRLVAADAPGTLFKPGENMFKPQ